MPKSDPIFKKYGFGLDQMYGSGSEQNAQIPFRLKFPDSGSTKIPGSDCEQNARIQVRTNGPDPDPQPN